MIDKVAQMQALLVETTAQVAQLRGEMPGALPFLMVAFHAALTNAHNQMAAAYPPGPEVCEQLGFDLEKVLL